MLVRRRYVAVADKGWQAHGVNPDVLIEQIAAHDPWVGAQLRVARAFGLRVKEAVMLRPDCATKPDEAGTPERYLEVTRGTKGGRLRLVPIDTEPKRAALEAARRLVGRESGHLGHPARDLKQNLDRLHYVMRKFGVTRRALGITAHGLRHGYAADRYEALAGTPAPIRGGCAPEKTTDRRARLAVAEELGHGRKQIVGVYISARPTRSEGT
jgi:integrase